MHSLRPLLACWFLVLRLQACRLESGAVAAGARPLVPGGPGGSASGAGGSAGGQLWVDKHKPRGKDELVGNNTMVATLRAWLQQVGQWGRPSACGSVCSFIGRGACASAASSAAWHGAAVLDSRSRSTFCIHHIATTHALSRPSGC